MSNPPLTDNQIKAALAAVTDENPTWQAMLQLLDKQIEDETEALLFANLADSAAQFNRGRLAGLRDMRSVFHQVRKIGQEEMQK